MEQKVTLCTNWDKKRLMDLNFFHTFRRSRKTFILWGLLALFLVISGILGAVTGSYTPFLYCVIFLAIYVVLFFVVMHITVARQIKTNRLLGGSRLDIVVDGEGVHLTQGENASSFLSWGTVYRVYKTKKNYYIYQSSMQAVLLPLDCIIEGDVETLDALIDEHIEAGKIAKR